MTRDPLANPEPLIRRLYSYVAYMVGDGPDAEDVTSEAFERALRYRKSYDASKGTPIAWLTGIARRCIADRRTSVGADDPPEGAAESFESGRIGAALGLQTNAVEVALHRLHAKLRSELADDFGPPANEGRKGFGTARVSRPSSIFRSSEEV